MHDHHGISLGEQPTIVFLLDHACRFSNGFVTQDSYTSKN